MYLIDDSTVEITGAVTRTPKLSPGGLHAHFTLAGSYVPPVSGGSRGRPAVFYLPIVASASLAGRVSSLGSGEAVQLRGILCEEHGQLKCLVKELSRLPHDPTRLEVDGYGTPRLRFARLRVSGRGVLVAPPQRMKLDDGTVVTNARLGLRPRKSGVDVQAAPLVITEIAAYGDWGERLSHFGKDQYLHIWGSWQRRKGTQPGQIFTRLEVRDLEALHEARALI